MTEKNPDNPLPESDDNPSFEDVSSEDENELTVILPEEMTEDVGQEVTEEVPGAGSGKSGEVFVLLPDGDDSQIPMVETQEVPEITEEIEGPRLASVYEAATAEDVGLRRENPIHSQVYETDTEIDPYTEPTEECMVAEHPTETMSAGDLDDFASEVADEMLVSEDMNAGTVGYEEEGFDDYDEGPVYHERASRHSRRRRSPVGKVILTLAALIAIAATGVQFFPEYVGLDPSFDLKTFVMDHVNSLLGRPQLVDSSNVPDVPDVPPVSTGGDGPDSGATDGGTPPLAMAAQETFKTKFKQAIELGFGGEGPR